MLIGFSVGNYRSFKDVVTLSMVATNLRTKPEYEYLDQEVIFTAPDNKTRLLTSAVIYGANASGKSNLLRAFGVMRRLVLNSARETTREDRIDVDPFRLAHSTRDKPSFFEVVFFYEKTEYRYGFEVTSQCISREWLYQKPHNKSRESRLFERSTEEIVNSEGTERSEYNTKLKLSKAFAEGRDLSKKTRPNALFLSVVEQWEGKTAIQVVAWFRKTARLISGLRDITISYSKKCLKAEHTNREALVQLIRDLDLAIADVTVVERSFSLDDFPAGMPDEMKEDLYKQLTAATHQDGLQIEEIKTVHRVYNGHGASTGMESFDLDKHESDGTQKLVALAGPIVDALRKGMVLFVDEFDARLHPLLTRALMQLFNDLSTNPHHAQLIFTTHDTNLLSNAMLRRDQIWFTQKNDVEATELYSLAEFRVRNDESYERKYLQGRYGAIPYISDLIHSFGVEDNVETLSS